MALLFKIVTEDNVSRDESLFVKFSSSTKLPEIIQIVKKAAHMAAVL
jgi:hypothetical protein